jgi:hypothetical protein
MQLKGAISDFSVVKSSLMVPQCCPLPKH